MIQYHPARGLSDMLAKIPIALALILTLLFSGAALPTAGSEVKREAASCVATVCVKGCCTSKACCAGAQQQDSRQSPSPSAPRPELQATALDFQIFAVLYAVPAEARNFIIIDEKSGGHALPPLVASCIQLI